jgi:protein phosphatase
MTLGVPDHCLIVLIGPSGSGKSTLARRWFQPTEVVSSDHCRALVSDDERDQAASKDAFDVLHHIVSRRLKHRRLTVVDATNVNRQARQPLVELARRYYAMPIALVLDMPETLCQQRNLDRGARAVPPEVVSQHHRRLSATDEGLRREGFRRVAILSSPEAVEELVIERFRLRCNRRDEPGPFDIVGDVHGCLDELLELLAELDYMATQDAGHRHGWRVSPPPGRKLVFVGDLVDRGPDSAGVLRLVMSAVADGVALAAPGNHDVKLLRALTGQRVTVRHGLQQTLDQLAPQPETFLQAVAQFLDELPSHYVFDSGKLAVAHAGIRADMQGRSDKRIREFCLYGETTGETDELGLPVRLDWAADYRGQAMVAHGHIAVTEARWVNGTIDLDTGCVFGGALTALRYPELELVSVPAHRVWYEPLRPLAGGEPRDSDALPG